MKNTRDAIQYGIETLKVSPEEMFALIKSSNGYTGTSYKRWLANEIIKIANIDGVGYSQLLVKKFAIIQSLGDNDSDDTIRKIWFDYMNKTLGANIYSVGIEEIGTSLDDVDWFNGLDIDSENSYFVEDVLPEEYRSDFRSGDYSLMLRMTHESASKDTDLYKDAKEYGLLCKNEDALMLYRICSLVEAFGYPKNFKLGILANTTFLYNKDNQEILKYFLNYFNYGGMVISSDLLFESKRVGGEYAFLVCTPRGESDEVQDGFVLGNFIPKNRRVNNEVYSAPRRFSRSSNSMLDYIISRKDKLDGEVYGYMCYNPSVSSSVWLSSTADEDISIPIVNSNEFDIIVYFAVSHAMSNFGMYSNIREVINGSTEYLELAYNCVPLFLCDLDSKFYADGTENKYSLNSTRVYKLLEEGEIYFSYESKELLSVCRDVISEDDYVSSVPDAIRSLNNKDITDDYLVALNNLKDYISMLYRKM